MKKILASLLMVASFSASAQVNNPFYDEKTGILTLPSVTVDGKKVKNVFIKLKEFQVMSADSIVPVPAASESIPTIADLEAMYPKFQALRGTQVSNRREFHSSLIALAGFKPKQDLFNDFEMVPGVDPNPGTIYYHLYFESEDGSSVQVFVENDIVCRTTFNDMRRFTSTAVGNK